MTSNDDGIHIQSMFLYIFFCAFLLVPDQDAAPREGNRQSVEYIERCWNINILKTIGIPLNSLLADWIFASDPEIIPECNHV